MTKKRIQNELDRIKDELVLVNSADLSGLTWIVEALANEVNRLTPKPTIESDRDFFRRHTMAQVKIDLGIRREAA